MSHRRLALVNQAYLSLIESALASGCRPASQLIPYAANFLIKLASLPQIALQPLRQFTHI